MRLPSTLAILSSRLQRGLTTGQILIVTLCAILLMAAGGSAVFWWKENQENPTRHSAGPKIRMQPISLPEKALTNDAVRAVLTPWLSKIWQADGLKDPTTDIISPAAWKTFAQAAIAEELGSPEALAREELDKLAEDLVPVAGSHPVAAAVVGHVLDTEHEGREELLSIAWDKLSAQEGAEHLAWLVACDLTLTEGDEDTDRLVLVKQAMAALRDMLEADAGLSGHHDQIAAWLLMDGAREFFYSGTHREMWPVLQSSTKLKPWLKQWAEGQHHILAAWEARGGGYTNTVTPQGWRVFEQELQKAQKPLEDSWNLKPQHAGPAAALAYSALGAGDKEGPRLMRKWFDEAVRVHADHEDSYRHMLWGLRKRWFGNPAKMAAFGETCLETERFDTDAPWFYMVAHMDCASEWDLPDCYFLNFHHFPLMQKLFEGYEKSDARKAWREHDRTQAAVVSYKCAEYGEALKWLEKLNFQPKARVLSQWGLDRETFVGKIKAFASSKGETLREAEDADENFRSASAQTLYKKALEGGPEFSDAARRLFEKRMTVMGVESLIQARKPASLIPTGDLVAWETAASESWKPTADGKALEFAGVEGVGLLTHLARMGPNVVISGEFELENPGERAEVALTFGYPPPVPQGRWGAVRFQFAGGEARVILTSQFGEPEHLTEIEPAAVYSFVLELKANKATLTVEDHKLWDKVTLPRNTVKERYAQIGIAAASTSDQTRVRFTRLEVRRP